MVNLSIVETLTSREAADVLGIRVQRWHRLAAQHNLSPQRELPGIRGAKFWRLEDVGRIRQALATDQPVEAAS